MKKRTSKWFDKPWTKERLEDTIRCLIPVIIYAFVYFTWFFHLEGTKELHYTEIHAALDDKIPFLEIFIIPYLGWFVYCSFFFFLFLLMYDMEDFFKNAAFFFTGMTLFLIISSIWPNIQYMRPAVMPRDNIFTHMIQNLYKTDTPTNLWPSIHVYNAIGTHLAISNSKRFEKWLKNSSLVFCILIILSTMFIKQHSVIDVLGGIIFAVCSNLVVYKSELIVNAYHRFDERQKTRRALQ
ncbi:MULTISPECIES: phosphatase PAP2 family protein [unclassified Butyrivibrio]|uniref:phosphatase PAP2 family protein n=1 Tax=unclassified Butyrivibrio TaxID=2639466 RepID=UPI000420A674|nr:MULTISPECIES: phosphatase PAP2 family protein [unclassified Butyrivibrio]SDB62337.1 PAP2 superfamily [Butyrivibrio sp. INlla16]SEL44949.1 PAP2 superfamily [Butyrivibrio sp. ob235]